MSTVLVVDDSPIDRELVTRILSKDASLTVEAVEDGAKALTRLTQGGVDVVVTDLQMPEVDGLQLMTSVRANYSDVPVILMTALGSEDIAVEALEQGAASYVPKMNLNDRLLGTVLDILAFRQTERAYQVLIACFNNTRFNVSLINDPRLIDPLVDYIQQIVTGMKLCDAAGGYQVGVALHEALSNALYRGNLEITREQMQEERERIVLGQSSLIDQRQSEPPFCDRQIHVNVEVTRNEMRCIIRDEGSGFDVSALPPRDSPDDALQRDVGRGQMLMQTFMDDVSYNDTGNEVTLVKRRVLPN